MTPPEPDSPDSRNPAERLLRARLTRRQLLAGALGAVGAAAAGRLALGQSPPPVDTTKVPGFPATEVGARTPFEQPTRMQVGQHSWFAPIDRTYGIITPLDLHYVVSHAGTADVAPSAYKLLIHGMVDSPRAFTLADLRRFPSVSVTYSIEVFGQQRQRLVSAGANGYCPKRARAHQHERVDGRAAEPAAARGGGRPQRGMAAGRVSGRRRVRQEHPRLQGLGRRPRGIRPERRSAAA